MYAIFLKYKFIAFVRASLLWRRFFYLKVQVWLRNLRSKKLK